MLRLTANNLGRAAARSTTRQTITANRSMITSAQKRALKKDQIGASTESKTAKPPTKTATPPPTGGSSSGGGGGGTPLPILAGLAAAAVGGAYYMDLIPKDIKDMIPSTSDGDGKANVEVEAKKEEKAVESAPESVATPDVKSESVASAPVKEVEEPKEESQSISGGNQVVQISLGGAAGRTSDPVPVVEHPSGGNRVPVAFGVVSTAASTPTTATTEKVATDAAEARKELTSSPLGESEIDQELAKAHAVMKSAVDETYLKDLENLSVSELRIRIVQLSSEMNERTKWEAVRLREFLGMKEKEVGEKYMEKMQKQRLEFEDLLARRLREQEGSLTKAANDSLEAKERSIESVVNAAASAQQAEYEAALKSNTEQLQTELSAQYEAEFGTKLAEEKASMIKSMEKANNTINDLSNRLQQAEQNLTISRNFESSSQRAHRVSAAALALAEKMETNAGAAEELAALKAAAAESGVIASALEKVPASVKVGIPTLPELQDGFDVVYDVGREAAYVPVGRSGIGAQFAGKAFATISAPPSADGAAPECDDAAKITDYHLSRAKRHVKLGELEESVSELDKLKGQAAFTVSDWKTSAMDRVAVEKALKVIKMECALLNKNMSG